jgi:hypothetical protein
VFSSDISSLEPSSFGTIPSYEEVKDDLAICTIPNINIGKFSFDLVKTWIETVALSGNSQKISKAKPTIAQIYIDFTYYGNILLAYIESEYEKEKRKSEGLPLRLNGKNEGNHSGETVNEVMETSSHTLHSSAPSSVVNDHSHGSTSVSSSSLLTKRKYSDNFSGLFGRTTIANRQQQPSSSTTLQDKLDSFPGKLLLKILPKDIIKQKLSSPKLSSPSSTSSAPVPRASPSSSQSSSSSSSSMVLIPYDENDVKIVNDYFHAAIQRRSSFDKMVQEKQNNLELEKKRLIIEKETNVIPARKKMIELNQQQKQHLVLPSSEKEDITSVESITYLDEIDLEDLIGGPITSVRAPVANKPLPSAIKKKVEKPIAPVSASSSSSATKTAPKKAEIPVVKQEPASSSSASKLVASPPTTAAPLVVKQEPQLTLKMEPIASSSKEAPPVIGSHHQPPAEPVKDEKKLGMKPRRKIVIS